MLGRLVEEEARRRGMKRLMLNAALTSTGFYEKLGWHPEVSGRDRAEADEYHGRSVDNGEASLGGRLRRSFTVVMSEFASLAPGRCWTRSVLSLDVRKSLN